ncbi:MAG: chromosome segregation protein SMC [Clostridia bacterium]|nr:chromosome segregation protein SMC [Clostridia bacterium]
MYLKRIEMQGFKSFADKISIEVGSGVTAIVGPNGSGKSNISDALRWVMGEQSAKSLRSGKMEDVIFNGTLKRKPLSFAEVTLVLDNENHFFASDYKELAVTRRVFRSGESEYLINGAQVRLKDVHELFMDTGLGREGYSIVGQGKIDEIISAKSDDRRQVFEEASGISKYRYRKSEAERKLERTEDNLVRVRDILSELDSRIEPLRIQSEKAKKYLALRDELKETEVGVSIDIIDKNNSELEKQKELMNSAQQDLENAKKLLSEAEEESESLYASMRESDERTAASRAELDKIKADAAQKSSEIAVLNGKIQNYEQSIAASNGEIAANEKLSSDEELTLSSLFEAKTEAERTLAQKNEELAALEEAGAKASENMNLKGEELEQVRQKVREEERKCSDADNKSRSLDLLKESVETRRFTIEAEITDAKDGIERLEEAIAQLNGELAALNERRLEKSKKMADASSRAESSAKSAESKKDEFNRMSALLGEKQGRLKMLEEMERSLEGYQRSVRDLIKAHQSGRYRGNIVGVLSKLISVPKEYSTAIEIALGGAMQNIVVPREEDAKEAVNFLKENRLGRVTFLPLSSQEKRRLDGEAKILSHRGVVGIAADLVEREGYLDNTVESLLGRVVVTATQDDAIALAKEYRYKFKIVTLAGEEFRPGGSITGGSINRAVSVLGRADEIEALKKEVKALQKSSEKAEDDIADLSQAAREIASERENLRVALSKDDVSLSRLEAERKATEDRLKGEKERLEKLQAEKSDIAYKMLNNSNLKRDYALEREEAEKQMAKYERELEAKQAALNEAMEKKDKSSSEIFEKKMDISSASKDIEIISERITASQSRIAALKSEIEAKHASAQNARREIDEAKSAISKLQSEAEDLNNTTRSLEEKIASESAGKSGADERAARLREEIRGMNDTVYSLQNEVVRLETAQSKLNYNIETATNRLWDEYELTYSEALKIRRESIPIAEAQKRVSSLRGSIRALGSVNVDACEEYREVNERYEFLSGQVKDMDNAKAQLEKLIAEITDVMKTIFAEKFKEINSYFGEIFVELFGGGKASVSLTDKSNILESGIEIEVQPPGKKLQSIAPLSGGEKALTAIALLFALMKVSPSPFVVLDEIEAALDDINVYRFAEYMRRRTDTTQFIVITHRRGTMESADVLYGVTMQEKGVSKLLSMKLEDVEKQAN